jgi:transcriptional regulator with XRE-family HTH domain
MSDATSRPELKTLADRLNYLFDTVRPVGKPHSSLRDVVEGIARDETVSVRVSATYIHNLRTGKQDNPGIQQLTGIANFFGVKPSFLLGEGDIDGVIQDLETLKRAVEVKEALADPNVAKIATAARGLSPEMLRFALSMLGQARQSSEPRPDDQGGNAS